MKKIIQFLIPIAVSTLLVGGIILAANQFPTAKNNWSAGDVIESDWANALEDRIGIVNDTNATSLTYLLTNASSTDPGHGHTSLVDINGNRLATTTGNLIVGDGVDFRILSVGTDGQVLTASSSVATGLVWDTVSIALLSDIGDVSLTSLATNDMLFYTAGSWQNIRLGSGLTITGSTLDATLGDTIDAGEITAGAIDGDDINSNIAGRSLTLTVGAPDTLDADPELYTDMVSFILSDPATSDSGLLQHKFPVAVTITRISCSTDTASTTIQFDERSETTPNTAGTDVMTSALVCDSDSQATTSFTNAGIAADAPLNLDIDAVSGSPTKLRIHVDFTKND